MVAYLEKTDGNIEFHRIMDFLTRSSIYYALIVSPIVSTLFVEQFWMTAKSRTVNNTSYIDATVAGKPVTISEASIRSDLLFNDADGIDSLTNQAIFDNIQLMGRRKGDSSERHLKHPNPRSLQPYPSEDQSEPQPNPFLRPSSSNPILNSILEGSGGNHGDLKAQIKQRKKKAKHVILHHNAWIKSVSMKKRLARKKSLKTKLMQKESVSKQGRKPTKSKPTVYKDPGFDDLDDAMDYMETEDAHDEGTVKDSKETRVSTEDQVSTDTLKVSSNKPNKLLVKPNEGTTSDPKDGNSDESAYSYRLFSEMNENITQFLIDPKDKGNKVLEEKVESKNIGAESEGVNEAKKKFKMLANDEEIAKKVQEEWEAEEEKKKLAEEEASKAAFTNEYDFIQARLNEDKILAEKLQEEEREKFTIEHAQLNKKKFEEIQVMYEKVKRANENFIPIGSAKDEKLIKKMNEKAVGVDKEEVSKEPKSTKLIYYRVFRADGSSRWIKTFSEMIKFFDRLDLVEIHSLVMKRFETTPPEGIDLLLWGDLRIIVHVLRLEDGTEIKMLAERRYPLTKDTLKRIMDLRLTVVSDDDIVFDLLRFIEQQIDEFGGQNGMKSWLVQDQTVSVQKQTAFGKDKSNPLIVDSLLKTIRLSIHLVVYNQELAIPEQMATEGKLKENQGCRVDTDQVHQNGDLKNGSVWIHPPGLQDV
ncbi:hypothetical protein Tco_1312227 [Tanacetum coccineum]